MPKPGEPHLAVRAVHQNIGWLNIFVDQTALVNLAERCGDADRKAQEASHLYGRAEPPVEWLQTVNILEHQHGVTGVVHELQRPHRPRGVQLVLQSVLVSEPIEARARRVRSDGQNDQHSAPPAISADAPPSAEDTLAILPQNRTTTIRIAVGKPGQKYVPAAGS